MDNLVTSGSSSRSGTRRSPAHWPTEAWGCDHTDTARLAAVTNTAAQTDVVADIREAVRRSVETLKTLSDEDLAVEATSKNPRWGLKPAAFVIDELLVHHVAKHLGQIRRNVKQFGEVRFENQQRTRAMHIRIIGGGPGAGLFFAYLMGRAAAGHDIRVYERDAEGATYAGTGVLRRRAVLRLRHSAPRSTTP